jgi:cell wall-associated NlpC family hydrolase
MIHFFSTRERIEKLIHEAYLWLGTPFCHHAHARGYGVDCVHLASEIYQACGLLIDDRFPDYTMDGGCRLNTSLLEQTIIEQGIFKRVDNLDIGFGFLPGDLLTFRTGRVSHHVGVKTIGNKFIQARQNFGTIETELSDRQYRDLLVGVFRPLEV